MPARNMESTMVSARGGCNRCTATWSRKNALALAAQHHDRTGHETWAETVNRTVYGRYRGARQNPQGNLL